MMTSSVSRGLAVASLATLAFAGAAQASQTQATYYSAAGLEGLGAFTASVTYDYSGGTTASLTIAITNTSGADNGGYITAIALCSPSGATISSLLSTDQASFDGLNGPVSANPFGTFDAGASTSSSWLGGGNPSAGLGVGQTGTFVFAVLGTGDLLSSLDAGSILCSGDDSGMAVRFRGFENGGSDKVQGFIPAPGAFALLGIAGVLGARRRRA